MFREQLEKRARDLQTLLCIGIDPNINTLRDISQLQLEQYCKNIINQTKDHVLAYKLNGAFFEAFGPKGLLVFKEICQYLSDLNIPVISDIKRCDVSHTCEMYAGSIFSMAGSVTVLPLFGEQGLKPFIDKGKFLFSLCCGTENKELFTKSVGDKKIYEILVEETSKWNFFNNGKNVGFVVGLHNREEGKNIREKYPHAWFLTPGYGAQGGDIKHLKDFLRKDLSGVLVCASRLFGTPNDTELLSKAQKMKEEINKIRLEILESKLSEIPSIKRGKFILKSGEESNIYLDLRSLISRPDILNHISDMYYTVLETLEYDQIGLIPLAAVPIGMSISCRYNIPSVIPRQNKGYGTNSSVEGKYKKGERIVLIDDVLTSGDSKVEAINILKKEGLLVEDIIVLVDRQQGGRKSLEKLGIRVHAITTLSEIQK